MMNVCKECGREFQYTSFFEDCPKICDDCRTMLEIAMNADDYSIFENYLKGIK